MLSNAPDLSSPAPARPRRRLWRILLVLGVLFVLVLLLRPERTPSAAEQVPVPAGWPNQQASFKQRLQGSMPMWVWILRDKVRAAPRQLLIESAFLYLTNPVPAAVLPPVTPAFAGTNGLRIWIVSSNDWRAASERIQNMSGVTVDSRSRQQTSFGVPSTLFVGSSNQTLTIEHSSLLRGSVLDLTTVFFFTKATPPRTNGPFAARMQIPAGHRVLLLREPPPGDTSQPIALLLTPTLLPKK